MIIEQTEDEGLQALQNRRFDLLILDLMLPRNREEQMIGSVHLDAGVRILQELRENNNWFTKKDCPVIIFTARGNAIILDKVKKLIESEENFFQKPASLDSIFQRIINLLIIT